MIISIDTNKDSIDEIKKVIKFLKNIIEQSENQSVSDNIENNSNVVNDFFDSTFDNNDSYNQDKKEDLVSKKQKESNNIEDENQWEFY